MSAKRRTAACGRPPREAGTVAESLFKWPRRGGWWPGTTGRLLLVHGIALSVVLGAVLFEVVQGFSAHYTQTMETDLAEEAPEYARAAALRPSGQGMEAFTHAYLQTHVLPNGHVLIVDLSGQPALGTAGAARLVAAPVVSRWLVDPPAHSELRTVEAGGQSYLVLASPIQAAGSSRILGVLVAAADQQHLQAQRNQVLILAGTEAAVALLAALLSAFLLLRRVLRTVGEVTRAAVEASQGDLQIRLSRGASDDEVGRLTRAFDGMLARISESMEAQRRLLSDVSHQLRTPLTVALGHLEVLRRSPSSDPVESAETTTMVMDELQRMALLIDQLLLLGRSLSPDFIEVDRVDLRAFMADLFEASRVLGDRRWSLGEVPDEVLIVDGAKLRGALLNLVDNAVKATGPGDPIELEVGGEEGIVFTVRDSGEGIAPEVQPSVFERFRRAGRSERPGSGLGLAIVKAVAEAHGGGVELESAPGRGTTVRIVLPQSCLEDREGGEGAAP